MGPSTCLALGTGNGPFLAVITPSPMSDVKALPPHGDFKWDVAAFLNLAFVLATQPLANL